MNKSIGNSKMFKFYRNRNISRFILILSSVLLVIAFAIEKIYGHSILLSYVEFTIEAILVASIADGVAIYMFTMLIQKKREKLVSGVIVAFKEKFFPKKKLIEDLQAIRIVEEIKKISESGMIENNSEAIGKYISNILEKNKDQIVKILLNEGTKYVDSLDSNKFSEKLNYLIKNNYLSYKTVGVLVEYVEKYVKEPNFKNDIVQKLEQSEEKLNPIEKMGYSIAKMSNVLNYKELSERIEETLITLIDEIKIKLTNKNLYQMENEVSELVTKLVDNTKFMGNIDKIKSQAIANVLKPFLLKSISSLSVWLQDVNVEENTEERINAVELINSTIKSGISKLSENDTVVQKNYNRLIEKLVENEYNQILDIIEEVLSKLSDKNLVDKVNEVVGSNIQWLRISGAYVGAIVGFFIFTVISFPVIGLPIMVITVLGIMSSKKIRKRLVIYSK